MGLVMFTLLETYLGMPYEVALARTLFRADLTLTHCEPDNYQLFFAVYVLTLVSRCKFIKE